MAIIINEFEVVPEAAPPPPGNAGAQQQPPLAMIEPEEVRRVLLRQAERVARVWAD